MDIKLAFVVLLCFGLQLQNTIMIYIGKLSVWKNSPFSLQLYKNTWSFLNVYRAQIGKDGTPKMNLNLIQYRQWDFLDNDLLHGTHRLSRLLIVKSPQSMHPRYEVVDEGLFKGQFNWMYP